MFDSTDKVMIFYFIDGSNLFHSCKEFMREIPINNSFYCRWPVREGLRRIFPPPAEFLSIYSIYYQLKNLSLLFTVTTFQNNTKIC